MSSTKYEVRLTAKAEKDLDEILTWYSQRKAGAAGRRWLGRLLARVGKLEKNPTRCPVAHEEVEIGFELRELIFGRRGGKYRIFFTIHDQNVLVIRIRHAARDELAPGDLI